MEAEAEPDMVSERARALETRKLIEEPTDASIKPTPEAVLDAIHVAVMDGDTDFMDILVDVFHHDLDAENTKWKNTPLMAAVLQNKTDSVTWLLEQGVDVGKKDNSGKTALEVAEEQGYGEVAEILRDWETEEVVPDGEEKSIDLESFKDTLYQGISTESLNNPIEVWELLVERVNELHDLQQQRKVYEYLIEDLSSQQSGAATEEAAQAWKEIVEDAIPVKIAALDKKIAEAAPHTTSTASTSSTPTKTQGTAEGIDPLTKDATFKIHEPMLKSLQFYINVINRFNEIKSGVTAAAASEGGGFINRGERTLKKNRYSGGKRVRRGGSRMNRRTFKRRKFGKMHGGGGSYDEIKNILQKLNGDDVVDEDGIRNLYNALLGKVGDKENVKSGNKAKVLKKYCIGLAKKYADIYYSSLYTKQAESLEDLNTQVTKSGEQISAIGEQLKASNENVERLNAEAAAALTDGTPADNGLLEKANAENTQLKEDLQREQDIHSERTAALKVLDDKLGQQIEATTSAKAVTALAEAETREAKLANEKLDVLKQEATGRVSQLESEMETMITAEDERALKTKLRYARALAFGVVAKRKPTPPSAASDVSSTKEGGDVDSSGGGRALNYSKKFIGGDDLSHDDQKIAKQIFLKELVIRLDQHQSISGLQREDGRDKSKMIAAINYLLFGGFNITRCTESDEGSDTLKKLEKATRELVDKFVTNTDFSKLEDYIEGTEYSVSDLVTDQFPEGVLSLIEGKGVLNGPKEYSKNSEEIKQLREVLVSIESKYNIFVEGMNPEKDKTPTDISGANAGVTAAKGVFDTCNETVNTSYANIETMRTNIKDRIKKSITEDTELVGQLDEEDEEIRIYQLAYAQFRNEVEDTIEMMKVLDQTGKYKQGTIDVTMNPDIEAALPTEYVAEFNPALLITFGINVQSGTGSGDVLGDPFNETNMFAFSPLFSHKQTRDEGDYKGRYAMKEFVDCMTRDKYRTRVVFDF